jgi:hypothetical protein
MAFPYLFPGIRKLDDASKIAVPIQQIEEQKPAPIPHLAALRHKLGGLTEFSGCHAVCHDLAPSSSCAEACKPAVLAIGLCLEAQEKHFCFPRTLRLISI